MAVITIFEMYNICNNVFLKENLEEMKICGNFKNSAICADRINSLSLLKEFILTGFIC